MDVTVLIALITAIAAIIAPVITAAINNKCTIKLKRMEMEQETYSSINLHEREVLEKALSGIGILMSWKDRERVQEACKNIMTAVAYVNEYTGEELRKIVCSALDSGSDLSMEEYAEICNNLSGEIRKRTDNKDLI